MRQLLIACLACVCLLEGAAAQERRNVLLITLDGARIEEMFGGLDATVLRSTLDAKQVLEDHPLFKRYWAPTPELRREKLMPFFWGTLMRDHGSIAGNRAVGSRVELQNKHWFSYPGYSEILVGAAHDDVIKSNDPIRNPYPTLLELLRTKLGATAAQVALFASWEVFNAIGESREGAVTINAGYEAFAHPDPDVARLSALQFETPTPWNSVRHDAYTFRFAMAHLAAARPRVLYLALGETDDWAHDGRYDRVIETYVRTDEYLKQLWTWLQSQDDYRGSTSLLITTDHGRGRTPGDWKHHGDKYAGSGDTWMAFVTPAMRSRGEWRQHAPIATAQAAATIVGWMGFDWRELGAGAAPPVGDPGGR